MSIAPDWLLRARNGLGPAIPPAALRAIMGSDEASYTFGFCGGGGGGGNGVGSGGNGGIGYGDGNGSGYGSGCGNGWGNGGGDGCGGDGYGVWTDPANYFEDGE